MELHLHSIPTIHRPLSNPMELQVPSIPNLTFRRRFASPGLQVHASANSGGASDHEGSGLNSNASRCPFTGGGAADPARGSTQLRAMSTVEVTATELPPAPWNLPFIGSLHHLAGSPLPHHALRDLANAYGPIILLKLGEIDTVLISSREGAEEVMRTQDANFANRPVLTAPSIVCYGCKDIAFSSQSDYWRQLRKICVMELLSGKRVRSFSSLRAQEVDRLIRDLSAKTGAPANLSEMVAAMTNTVVSKASFGNQNKYQDKFINTVKEAMTLANGFNVADLFPSLTFLDVLSGVRARLERIHTQMDVILDRVIKDRLVTFNPNKPEEEEDLLDVLLKFKERSDLEVPITYDNIKAVILDMFVGGTETSSTTVEWAMSELVRHPWAMAKAQEEVRAAMKGKQKIGQADIEELPYLKNVIKETLRVHPPVPLLVPRVPTETAQVLNYKIPAGTRVIINAWAMARDPKYWEKPESFKPERFEVNNKDYRGGDFEFIPFGAGRRICPGLTFGVASVELALANLLFYYDWKLPYGMKPADLDMTETFGASAVRKTPLLLEPVPRMPLPTV